ncbi:MAG: type III pantothenate kinase [Azonexus sp.]|nr:type III pantothenate kinase [Azonexus sp.]
MILCIDSGNSRIKWAWLTDGQWSDPGTATQGDFSALTALAASLPSPRRILLANVAGDAVAASIVDALAPWQRRLDVVRSEAAAFGVINGYQNPQRLGVDRWCALIGARAMSPTATLVVMAGTATTIDTLTADGRFAGGLILPGQQLMLTALARETAALPFAQGQHQALPMCTEDAIVSGAIEAQVGAIERAWARLPATSRVCLISGGNAPLLVPHLALPCQWVDNLPLAGLKVMAASGRMAS